MRKGTNERHSVGQAYSRPILRWLWAPFAFAALCLASVAPTHAEVQPSAGAIASVYYPDNQQLEVIWVGDDGAVNDIYKDHNSRWRQPIQLAPPGSAPADAHVSVTYQVQDDHLEMFSTPAPNCPTIFSRVHGRGGAAWLQVRSRW